MDQMMKVIAEMDMSAGMTAGMTAGMSAGMSAGTSGDMITAVKAAVKNLTSTEEGTRLFYGIGRQINGSVFRSGYPYPATELRTYDKGPEVCESLLDHVHFYEGKLEKGQSPLHGIPVRVKAIRNHVEEAFKEIGILHDLNSSSRSQENIIRMFTYQPIEEEHDGENVIITHIALEPWHQNLKEFMKDHASNPGAMNNPLPKLFSQVLRGLEFIHVRRIAHGSLALTNILLCKKDSAGDFGDQFVVVLSDFSQAHELSTNDNDDDNIDDINHLRKLAQDIIRVGHLLFLCCYTPVGSNENINISTEAYEKISLDSKSIMDFVVDKEEARSAVELMRKTDDTISAAEPVTLLARSIRKKHPFFWSSETKLKFLMHLLNPLTKGSDKPDKIKKVPTMDDLRKQLDRDKEGIWKGYDWLGHLDTPIQKKAGRDMLKHKSSVADLIRLIRNVYVHRPGAEDLHEILYNNKDDGFWGYFRERFPKLLLHVYEQLEQINSDGVRYADYFGMSEFYVQQ